MNRLLPLPAAGWNWKAMTGALSHSLPFPPFSRQRNAIIITRLFVANQRAGLSAGPFSFDLKPDYMKDLNNNSSSPLGCTLFLVLGTVFMIMAVKAMKLPREAESKALADVTLPLTTVVSIGLLLLIIAVFKR